MRTQVSSKSKIRRVDAKFMTFPRLINDLLRQCSSHFARQLQNGQKLSHRSVTNFIIHIEFLELLVEHHTHDVTPWPCRKSFGRPTKGGQPWRRRVCEDGHGFQRGHCRHASIYAGCPHRDGRTTQVPSVSKSAGTPATWWGAVPEKWRRSPGGDSWGGVGGGAGGSWVGGSLGGGSRVGGVPPGGGVTGGRVPGGGVGEGEEGRFPEREPKVWRFFKKNVLPVRFRVLFTTWAKHVRPTIELIGTHIYLTDLPEEKLNNKHGKGRTLGNCLCFCMLARMKLFYHFQEIGHLSI